MSATFRYMVEVIVENPDPDDEQQILGVVEDGIRKQIVYLDREFTWDVDFARKDGDS